MLKIFFIIFKGQPFWLGWAGVCRIHLTSSVICLPQAMSCCLSAESEDSPLFYYYWKSFMLIINHFNTICHWKAPTPCYCTNTYTTLSAAYCNPGKQQHFSLVCYPQPRTIKSPYHEPQGSAKKSLIFIYWGAKGQVFSWESHNGAMIFSVKLLSKKILLMAPCWEDFPILFSYQRAINIKNTWSILFNVVSFYCWNMLLSPNRYSYEGWDGFSRFFSFQLFF